MPGTHSDEMIFLFVVSWYLNTPTKRRHFRKGFSYVCLLGDLVRIIRLIRQPLSRDYLPMQRRNEDTSTIWGGVGFLLALNLPIPRTKSPNTRTKSPSKGRKKAFSFAVNLPAIALNLPAIALNLPTKKHNFSGITLYRARARAPAKYYKYLKVLQCVLRYFILLP